MANTEEKQRQPNDREWYDRVRLSRGPVAAICIVLINPDRRRHSVQLRRERRRSILVGGEEAPTTDRLGEIS
ncbi:hypothetical protein E2562_002457 [Oryza meyeriana var. granulata]|uniref:Uncharacterized protein n=1 Tax=Oryza meyeriana var. granulata TaxID=110450 RepID=A0A6G1F2M8_9ORYZ|nr:hypothetical protein E2562_002457 [Oryza meyeriana var. granulata]